MSLILLESFDSGDYDQRIPTWGVGTLQTAQVRTGTYSVAPSSSGNFNLTYEWTDDAHTTAICGFGMYLTTQGAIDTCRFYEGNTEHGVLRRTSDGNLHVDRGGTNLGSTTGGVLSTNTWQYIEFKYTCHDTTGAYEVWVDGTSVLSDSGIDTRNGGTAGEINKWLMGYNFVVGYVDDIYILNGAGSVNNARLGQVKIETIFPNGNGNYSQLTGSDADQTDNYLLVDESPNPSDSDYTESSTVGNKDTYAFGNLPAGASAVKGVEVRFNALKSTTSTRKFRRVHRRASTDDTGSDVTLSETASNYYEMLDQDSTPATPIDWTVANFNASEFGFEVR